MGAQDAGQPGAPRLLGSQRGETALGLGTLQVSGPSSLLSELAGSEAARYPQHGAWVLPEPA